MSRKTEEFGKELNLIGDAERRLFVSRCLENVADYFFEVPASSTGKYHPSYSLDRDSSPCPRTIGQYDPRK